MPQVGLPRLLEGDTLDMVAVHFLLHQLFLVRKKEEEDREEVAKAAEKEKRRVLLRNNKVQADLPLSPEVRAEWRRWIMTPDAVALLHSLAGGSSSCCSDGAKEEKEKEEEKDKKDEVFFLDPGPGRGDQQRCHRSSSSSASSKLSRRARAAGSCTDC